MTELVITNVRPLGAASTTITIDDGRIAAIGGATRPGAATLDAGGRPGTARSGRGAHASRQVARRAWIGTRMRSARRSSTRSTTSARPAAALGLDPRRQSERLARLALSHGSTLIRSHVDVDTEMRLCVMSRACWRRATLCAIWSASRPSRSRRAALLIRPGTLALMEAALRLGAEVVGGLDPCAIDRDPKGHLDAIFGLAERFGRPLDIHLHEPGEMGAFSIELIVERTRALGMAGRVAISHAFCLGMVAPSAADALIAALAEAGIAIVTTAPPSRPAPPLRRLLAAGVLVAAGSDGVRDTWGPYGNADMLERAMLLGMRQDMRRDDELAQVLRLLHRGRRAAARGGGVRPEAGRHRRSRAGGCPHPGRGDRRAAAAADRDPRRARGGARRADRVIRLPRAVGVAGQHTVPPAICGLSCRRSLRCLSSARSEFKKPGGAP